MMKNVAILGSTGSIGVNALKVIESLPDRFRVVGLSSFSNTDLLAQQINRFKPLLVNIVDHTRLKDLKKKTNSRSTRFFSKEEGLNIIAESGDVDIVIIAIAGSSAIHPLLASIEAGKHICLANKESIVIAGNIIMQRVRDKSAKLIPVDSEHSAIFQCLNGSEKSSVYQIYLTGSGGPLHKMKKESFKRVSVQQVLNHPKWKMGRKITVDSATLMNKGLEMIEAQHLFNISVDKIRLLIHPEAIVHSMVEFSDGAVIAQLGVPDMRLPIQYALTFPDRMSTQLPRVDFSQIRNLGFYTPDTIKYPCLELAMAAAKLGDTYPAVLNACDEEAVKAFLGGKISFVKIAGVIEKVLHRHRAFQNPTLSNILEADRWAREEAKRLW